MKKNLKKIAGITLIEMLVGIAVTALMMGAMFATYTVVNNSYRQVIDKATISRSGRDIVGMMIKDIRLAGFRYYHGENSDGISSESDLTHISGEEEDRDMIDSHDPLIVIRNTLGYYPADQTDQPIPSKHKGKDTCCDRIHIVYEDFDETDPKQKYKKYRISYFGLPMEDSANDKFYGIYKTKESWIQNEETPLGTWISSCTECYKEQLVRSHLVDMEFLAFDEHGHHLWSSTEESYPQPNNSTRSNLYKIRQVDLALTFRSDKDFYKKNLAGNNKRYVKTLNSGRITDHDGFQDKYLRESIVVSIHTRNIGG